MKLTDKERAHLELLNRIGATRDRPAFWEDYGELSPSTIGSLRLLGLADRQHFRRYGGPRGERRATGYWITPAGRAALQSTGR